MSVKKNILFIDIFAIYVGRSGAEKFYLCSHGVDDFDSVLVCLSASDMLGDPAT